MALRRTYSTALCDGMTVAFGVTEVSKEKTKKKKKIGEGTEEVYREGPYISN